MHITPVHYLVAPGPEGTYAYYADIAAILTVLPDLAVALWDAVQRGDHATARALHERMLPVWTAINHPDMSARTKAAIDLRGRRVGAPRRPLLPVGAAVRDQLASALGEAGVRQLASVG